MRAQSRPSPRTAALRGMTLVEVLAVVVILSLVAGTLYVGFSGSFGKAKRELAKTGMTIVAGKLEAYRIERGAYPTGDAGLAVLTAPAANATHSFYLPAEKLLDPWGRQYLYLTPGPDGEPFELVSFGGDGKQGGAGEDQDISSARLREDGLTP